MSNEATIYPYKKKIFGEIKIIYAINEYNPLTTEKTSITNNVTCPKCNVENLFTFYKAENIELDYSNGRVIETYNCKCPNCRTLFKIKL